MEYWSHGGTKNFRLGPSFHGILVPRTNFFGDQFSSDRAIGISTSFCDGGAIASEVYPQGTPGAASEYVPRISQQIATWFCPSKTDLDGHQNWQKKCSIIQQRHKLGCIMFFE